MKCLPRLQFLNMCYVPVEGLQPLEVPGLRGLQRLCPSWTIASRNLPTYEMRRCSLQSLALNKVMAMLQSQVEMHFGIYLEGSI